ncbi:hypothetical protein GGH97_000412 [Coemansia sp. RSA 475]|nr:hypothetical protein GGH97_000412 [Coemansia sp. RSA 475]KAJ2550148.1 hypothetical protein IWW35_003433 [Coemansia sp. RSA 1878]
MIDRPRTASERERQQREKRLFLSVAGIGFTGSLLAAVALGHRRAHRAAKAAGESITHNQVNWAFRAFGLGTMYAFAIVGCGAAIGSYYMQQRGVTSMSEFAAYMRGRVQGAMGTSMKKRHKVEGTEDAKLLDTANSWLDQVDEESNQKKISFSKIKALANSEKSSMSIGERMRAVFGFNKKE